MGSLACSNPVEDDASAATPEVTPVVDEEQTGELSGTAGEAGEEGGEGAFAPASAPIEGGTAEQEPVEEEETAKAPTTTPAPVLLAGEAARQLSRMKVTAYEHTTFVDETTGTFKYDCSGFLGYALKRALPAQLAAIKTFHAVSRPLAKHFELFFAAIEPGAKKSGWSRVARAIDLQPGDVVAWLKPADLVSNNTGHVMIVSAKPTVNPKRPDEVIVPIIDSSASFHGSTDSRYPSEVGGLGSGPIGLIVDGSGVPVRYRWNGGVSTKEWSTAISLGRPE